jgi:hypothetical protein
MKKYNLVNGSFVQSPDGMYVMFADYDDLEKKYEEIKPKSKKRILLLEIYSCEKCFYCMDQEYNDENGWIKTKVVCSHKDSTVLFIANRDDINKDGWPDILEGCPLPKR